MSIQDNTAALQELLNIANNLPEAGSGGVEVKTKSGNFTSNNSSTNAVTVSCGFQPDVVRLTLNETYNNMNVEVTVDFNENGGKKTALAMWSSGSTYSIYSFIVERKTTGFSVIAYAYDSSWSMKTFSKRFYYNAVKYTE